MITKTIVKKEFPTREDVVRDLKKFEKYFNDEMYDYLYALVNLDESVFSDKEFMDEFHTIDEIFEIAKYNFCKRMEKRLRNVEGIDSSLLSTSIVPDGILSIYSFNDGYDDYSFRVLDASFNKKNMYSNEVRKPCISFLDAGNDIDRQLYDVSESVANIENKDYEDMAKRINRGKIKLFSKNYVTSDELREHDLEYLSKLKEELVDLQKTMDEKKKYINLFKKVILDELYLTDESFDGKTTKKLSWVDIKNHQI